MAKLLLQDVCAISYTLSNFDKQTLINRRTVNSVFVQPNAVFLNEGDNILDNSSDRFYDATWTFKKPPINTALTSFLRFRNDFVGTSMNPARWMN